MSPSPIRHNSSLRGIRNASFQRQPNGFDFCLNHTKSLKMAF